MPTIQIRLYEELNDHLPVGERKRTFSRPVGDQDTVGELLQALGVPPSEVELVLVDGRSVDLDQVLRDGDRVSVYPVFEALDVSSLVRLRERPLRRPRFLVVGELKAVARYLRLLGFDVNCQPGSNLTRLVELSRRERRIVLSRDDALLNGADFTHTCHMTSGKPRQQLREVLSRLDLHGAVREPGRCPRCNTVLDREAAGGRHPGTGQPPVCAGCGHRWPVVTWRRLRRFLRQVLECVGEIRTRGG
jgi:uncharacterized protein with PIN domain/sulfur carrier protein ThiS